MQRGTWQRRAAAALCEGPSSGSCLLVDQSHLGGVLSFLSMQVACKAVNRLQTSLGVSCPPRLKRGIGGNSCCACFLRLCRRISLARSTVLTQRKRSLLPLAPQRAIVERLCCGRHQSSLPNSSQRVAPATAVLFMHSSNQQRQAVLVVPLAEQQCLQQRFHHRRRERHPK